MSLGDSYASPLEDIEQNEFENFLPPLNPENVKDGAFVLMKYGKKTWVILLYV